MAVHLGAAAEVLSYLDPDGDAPEFGSHHLGRAVGDVVSGFFELSAAGCVR